MSNIAAMQDTGLPIAGERIAVNGINLFTRSIGNAPPDVVVLHGGPSAGLLYLIPAIDDLAKARRLRYYDQRGCGRSLISPETPQGWREHARDLRALMDHWRMDEATIIGHSWGALLGLLYAIHNPGRVKVILLIAPAPVRSADRTSYLKELERRTIDLRIIGKQRELLKSELRKQHPEEFRQRAFQLSLAPILKDPSKVAGVAPFRISHRARSAVWRSLGEYDLSDELSKLTVEALVIHGLHDPIPLASSQRIARLLGARLELFENSGHMPFFEERERFLKASGDFLGIDRNEGN